MSKPNERVVVVSGATKGIGVATALHLDAIGFRVYAGYRSDADARMLAAQGSALLVPVRLDVTSEEDIAALAERVDAETGDTGLWGLVNNAGMVVAGPLEVVPPDAIRLQFDVNVHGVLRLTQALLPAIRTAAGRIVNVSSVNGRLATPYNGPYSASKFALEAMSDVLRTELARWGIKVSSVQPGAIRTAIWDTSRERALGIARELPAAAITLYPRLLDRLKKVNTPKHALPPDRVAAVIARALTAKRPRTRYRVGWDARVGVFMSHFVPDRLIDRMLGTRGPRPSPSDGPASRKPDK